MKKMIIGFAFALIAQCVQAQNGLESIIVEKYYVSNAADAAGSIGTLPAGSVTYRIYADMLPGYEFQAAYGVPGHELKLTTTTSFFNNEDRGATTPTYTKTQARGNTVMLDSWLSVGAGCSGNFGILKSEDDLAGGATVINNSVPMILQNAEPSAGIPLTTHDGLYAGTPEAVTFVGLTAAELDQFDATSQLGNSFITSNGSWASLNGSSGPIPATNKVLIAQITTDGVFHYELNIQIGTPTGGTENYVAMNPVGSEITIPSLMGTLGAANAAPTVSITSPTAGAGFITGAIVAINATAADSDGSISQVEFFVDGVSIGVDATAPYTRNYASVAGAHSLTAVATDNNGAQTTSAAININVANNPPPSVNITTPANGSSFMNGTIVAIAANATDNGSVSQVEFFVDGVSIGVDAAAPFEANYNSVLGTHSLTAKATDDQGAFSVSAVVSINVVNNLPPTVALTSPSNGAVFTHPALITISANANDADGTVAQVEFFVNSVSVGIDATAPYSVDWNSLVGNAVIKAVATDNSGAQTTSATRSISIADPNALPYAVITTVNTCLPGNFCIPVAAVDTVNDVIGYDVIMQYDKLKVMPTGVITMYSDLINPSYVDVINSIDTAAGTIYIAAFFNASAPANAQFTGVGNLFCVEFAKTAAFTSVDTTVISVTSLQESYFAGVATKLVDDGEYITYKDSMFFGALRFWVDNLPVKYNAADPNEYLITNIFGNNDSCNSPSAIAVQPDTNGNFIYNIWNGQYINIEKDILGTTDVQPVINGFDALLARKVLLNDPSFIPSIYQIVAMDVNTDGVVSAGDVSQINQRTVLMIPEFKQAWNYTSQGVSNGQPSKDWLFIDSLTITNDPAYAISSNYPGNDGVGYSKSNVPVIPFCLPVPVVNYFDCPLITSETYKGVLIGDINGNYSTTVPNGSFRTAGDKVVFDLASATFENGYIDIPVSFESMEVVNALDFAIQLNESALAFNSTVDLTNKMVSLSNFNNDDRTVRFTSSSITAIEENKSIVNVRFAMNGSTIADSDIKVVAGYLNGEKVEVEVRGARTSAVEIGAMVNVYPNPASGFINVTVSEDAKIQLLDAEGRVVILQSDAVANQKQEINLESVANGLYLMKIGNDNFNTVKKVMVNN